MSVEYIKHLILNFLFQVFKQQVVLFRIESSGKKYHLAISDEKFIILKKYFIFFRSLY